MKTRTNLVAAATATAVAISGANVAEAAPTVVDSGTTNTTTADEGSSIRDMDPSEIQDWLAVVTAILGIISQVASVAMKFMR
ncbi:hypothetical protein [Corynebacterium lujinxingii]|uniref:Secreted protein n=1 Tax=Corynebacterium lujinxingii TaxID=2763010 RepID=A0A7H0JWF0_9CORY|nr:hypothetical protein [Corynebacterium lujinxingii]MBC3178863.1 hypothetical protein [Corynebacterium lujinxingii]NNO11145.1 hypothetical protein [Corynebacterium lujinxingii]QNP89366.1 hypothetical protein IAU68_06490 [Corynebacterium lujinxingii]